MAGIPTIDFGSYTHDQGATCGQAPTTAQLQCARDIDLAFRKHGFLFLQNIGVSEEDLQGYFDMARELFSLPEEHKKRKLKALDPESNIGYAAAGIEVLNRKRGPDLKEAYNVRNTRFFDHDFSACPPEFGDKFASLWTKMEAAAHNFCIACAIALNLPHDFFFKALQACSSSVIRLNYYPPCDYEPGKSTGDDLSASLRVGEHTDFGMFTILFNNGPGLQVKAVEGGEVGGAADGEIGGWLDVPVPTGATAIINTGALMARWTNDIWRATAHRVIVSNADEARSDRYSIACFFDPDEDFIIEVDPTFVAEGETPKYKPITSRDYILGKLRDAQPEHLQ